MSASICLDDAAFDQLVAALEALANADRVEPVGRWEIRLTLGGYGVLPEGAVNGGEPEDRLIADLRSICSPYRSLRAA